MAIRTMAIRTMATLTMATLTVATLTMAIRTMATLTMATLTMALLTTGALPSWMANRPTASARPVWSCSGLGLGSQPNPTPDTRHPTPDTRHPTPRTPNPEPRARTRARAPNPNPNPNPTKDERIEQLHGEKERLEYERLMASQKSSRRRRASGSEGMPRSTGLELRLGLANRGCATQAGL
jgi:hypothetical protein